MKSSLSSVRGVLYVQTSSHARTLTCTHTRMHAHTHACTHACMHTRMHTRMHAHTHAHTYAHMHAHTHAHTHTHTHTHTLQQCLPVLLNLLVVHYDKNSFKSRKTYIKYFTDNKRKEKNRISYSFRLYSHIAIEQSFHDVWNNHCI